MQISPASLGAHQILESSPDSFMADGLTHLLVLRFSLSDQALSDSVFVYLDPTSVVEPEIPARSSTALISRWEPWEA